jgi:hypothetical protein
VGQLELPASTVTGQINIYLNFARLVWPNMKVGTERRVSLQKNMKVESFVVSLGRVKDLDHVCRNQKGSFPTSQV